MRLMIKGFWIALFLLNFIGLIYAADQAGTKTKLAAPATLTEKAPNVYRAKFETTKGVFVIEVTRAWAPLGADRFYNLVKNGFYDDCRFFRVVPNFMVQFGIHGDPSVSAAWLPSVIQDDPVKKSNSRGSITLPHPARTPARRRFSSAFRIIPFSTGRASRRSARLWKA